MQPDPRVVVSEVIIATRNTFIASTWQMNVEDRCVTTTALIFINVVCQAYDTLRKACLLRGRTFLSDLSSSKVDLVHLLRLDWVERVLDSQTFLTLRTCYI